MSKKSVVMVNKQKYFIRLNFFEISTLSSNRLQKFKLLA